MVLEGYSTVFLSNPYIPGSPERYSQPWFKVFWMQVVWQISRCPRLRFWASMARAFFTAVILS